MGSELMVVDGEVVPPSALAVASKQQNAAELYRHATDVAGACGEIVKRTAQAIQGRKYVRVEGWQAIATTYGCVASARDVERTPTGFRAIGEVRRVSDGAVIATAEGFVGDDETTWASRPEYAKRAMAQTRSISRACRSAFAFVVVLIDSDLSTTPAEEVPEGGFHDASKAMPKPAGVEALRAQVAPPKPSPAAPVKSGIRKHAAVAFRFGKGKGKTSYEIDDGALAWYIKCASESVNDPEKSRFREQNEQELAELQAEKDFRANQV